MDQKVAGCLPKAYIHRTYKTDGLGTHQVAIKSIHLILNDRRPLFVPSLISDEAGLPPNSCDVHFVQFSCMSDSKSMMRDMIPDDIMLGKEERKELWLLLETIAVSAYDCIYPPSAAIRFSDKNIKRRTKIHQGGPIQNAIDEILLRLFPTGNLNSEILRPLRRENSSPPFGYYVKVSKGKEGSNSRFVHFANELLVDTHEQEVLTNARYSGQLKAADMVVYRDWRLQDKILSAVPNLKKAVQETLVGEYQKDAEHNRSTRVSTSKSSKGAKPPWESVSKYIAFGANHLSEGLVSDRMNARLANEDLLGMIIQPHNSETPTTWDSVCVPGSNVSPEDLASDKVKQKMRRAILLAESASIEEASFHRLSVNGSRRVSSSDEANGVVERPLSEVRRLRVEHVAAWGLKPSRSSNTGPGGMSAADLHFQWHTPPSDEFLAYLKVLGNRKCGITVENERGKDSEGEGFSLKDRFSASALKAIGIIIEEAFRDKVQRQGNAIDGANVPRKDDVAREAALQADGADFRLESRELQDSVEAVFNTDLAIYRRIFDKTAHREKIAAFQYLYGPGVDPNFLSQQD
jgi:hypothetical protein